MYSIVSPARGILSTTVGARNSVPSLIPAPMAPGRGGGNGYTSLASFNLDTGLGEAVADTVALPFVFFEVEVPESPTVSFLRLKTELGH